MSDLQRPQPDQYDDEIDLLELFGVIWRYKWVVIGVTAAAAIGVVVFAIISLVLPPEESPLPNQYRPSALILINEDTGGGVASALASSGLGNLAGLAGVSGGQSYGNLAVKLLESKSTLDTIVSDFDIAERYEIEEFVVGNSRQAVRDRASFEYDTETGTVTVAYEDIDPEFARDVVNRFVEILDRRFATIGGNRNVTEKNLLESKLAEVEVEMARLEAQITEFQQRYGTLDIESLARSQVTMLAELRSQLILKEVEINTYSEFAAANDPVLRRLRSERQNLQQLIGEMEQGFSEFSGGMPTQQELPELALQFARLERDLRVQGEIYRILTQQYEIAKLDLEGQEPIFQVLELAEAPDLKSGPSRSIIVIVTTFAAFFFSIILVFILNAFRNIKNDPERMKKLRGEE